MADNENIEIVMETWMKEQEHLKGKLVTHDTEEWQKNQTLKLVGGLDLSFVKDHSMLACCTLVILSIPSLDVIYEDSSEVQLTAPYIPGFLAFREVEPCLTAFQKLIALKPELKPEVIFFDGNGIFHPRGLGLASHFGVLVDIPTIGVAKNLYQMGCIMRNDHHRSRLSSLLEPGSWFSIANEAGQVLAVALKTNAAAKPVYVSIGHRISLNTAIWAVMQTSRYRIPEPTRQADIRSRLVAKNTGNS